MEGWRMEEGGKKVGGERAEVRAGSGVRAGIWGCESTLGVRTKRRPWAGLGQGGWGGGLGLVLGLEACNGTWKNQLKETNEACACMCTAAHARVGLALATKKPTGRGNGLSRPAMQQLGEDLRVSAHTCVRTRAYGGGLGLRARMRLHICMSVCICVLAHKCVRARKRVCKSLHACP